MVEPQMVEQLVDMLSPLDFCVPEQVIEVPKASSRPLRWRPKGRRRRRRRRSGRTVWLGTRKLQRLWNERVSCWRARGGRGRRGGSLGLLHITLAAALVIDNGSGMLLAGFLPFTLCPLLSSTGPARLFGWHGPEGQLCCVVEAALVANIDSGFVLCFPSLSSGPGCAASCAVWTRRTVLQRDSGFSPEAYRNWIFLGDDFDEFLYSAQCLVRQRIHAHASDHGGSGVEVVALAVDTGSGMCFAGLLVRIYLALCSSPIGWLMMLGIMASMVQMDIYALGSGMYKAGIADVTVVACPL